MSATTSKSTNLNRAVASCTITVASLALLMGFASAAHSTAPNKRLVPERAASRAVCTAPAELVHLNYSLDRVTEKVLAKQAITIVAIGSSSTFGHGASSPAMSYPSRLAVELQGLFPDSPVTVVNSGVNGDNEVDMLARFDRDVFASKPDLVIWQVGSNSVLGHLPMAPTAALIRDGLGRLKAKGVDVIVVDPQYAPAIVKRHADPTVDMIALTAGRAHVNLFGRFAVMRHWRVNEHMSYSTFVSNDQLHMNDWGYGCIAKLLAGAINDVTTRPTLTAAK
jgi:acyl-CoA thioesterase-1